MPDIARRAAKRPNLRASDLPFEQIMAHDSALVVPFRRGKRTKSAFAAGVFDESGLVLPNTEMRMLNRRAAPDRTVWAEARDGADWLEGQWLFCGIASAQFGHIITRSLGRLWATERLPPDVRLLFASMMFNEDQHGVLTRILSHLGIQNGYRIIDRPTRVETLFTAPELFSEASEGVATPAFSHWVRQRATPHHDKQSRRKLYLTRGRLSPEVGRSLNEDVLERNLAAAGFEIVAPEALDLSDQFRLYAEAEIIIAAEGSALHVVPFSMRETATLVVIQRRKEVPVLIANQISSFTKARVIYVDAIRQVYWPQERADNVSLVSLDFRALRNALVEAEVLDSSSSWSIPTPSAELRSLHAGRPPDAKFLSDEERAVFLRTLRRQRRARRQKNQDA